MATSITLKKFQSFDEIGAGVADVARINVLVGANNSGKSKILKAIDRTIRPHPSSLIASSQSTYWIDVERDLYEDELRSVFRPGHYGGGIPGSDHWTGFGQFTLGSRITIRLDTSSDVRKLAVHEAFTESNLNTPAYQNVARETLQGVRPSPAPLLSDPVFHISAERDIVPETVTNNDEVSPNGRGVTNLFRRILNSAGRKKEPVERWLLADLNRILAPNHAFSRIEVQEHADGTWEIFLEETDKDWMRLSQCGSGLKTVIQLLAVTNLLAQREGGKIARGTLLLEEMENCLHPHVQRNLFSYLDEILELPARVFLTTHSPICLDYFQGHSDALLTHVYQEGGVTRTRTIEAFQDRCGVLDRMGSRASDALQSNAVVWVEGPSDRILLKKWFDLCGTSLREGRDFSIMFYGGSLLSHLTMDESKEVEEFVRLLRINRNSAILMDSDKKYQSASIGPSKVRVKDEAERERRFVWITRGKEIENYISPKFLERWIETPPQIGNYEPPWPKLYGCKSKDGTQTFFSKVEFANFVSEHATCDDFQLDWEERTRALIEYIENANRTS